jgi:hypothetical protein
MSENIKRIKSVELFPVVFDMLEKNQTVKITVTGCSMMPFMREGKDSVNLVKADYAKLKRGDIVLIIRDDGVFVMHRILKKTSDFFYMVGDAQQWIEGPLLPQQVKAVVESVWKDNFEIKCSNIIWKLISEIWLLLRPFRYKILNILRKIKKVLKCLIKFSRISTGSKR